MAKGLLPHQHDDLDERFPRAECRLELEERVPEDAVSVAFARVLDR